MQQPQQQPMQQQGQPMQQQGQPMYQQQGGQPMYQQQQGQPMYQQQQGQPMYQQGGQPMMQTQQQMHPIPLTYANLAAASGVAVRQFTQKGEALAQAFGVPYEQANKYKVSMLPAGTKVAATPDDQDRWKPTNEQLQALDTMLQVDEESSFMTRTCFRWLGCSNLRPLKMHFQVQQGSGDVFLLNRDFKCGGAMCCPLEMMLYGVQPDGSAPRPIGRVRENFSSYCGKCCAAGCLKTHYHNIDQVVAPAEGGAADGELTFETLYTLRANISCCGRVNNCCGATCCKNDAVFDILDKEENVVAHLQKTYATSKSCLGACFRCGFEFSNFLLEFPADSTPEQRILLVTSLFQLDYHLFESTGDEG